MLFYLTFYACKEVMQSNDFWNYSRIILYDKHLQVERNKMLILIVLPYFFIVHFNYYQPFYRMLPHS